MSEVAAVAECPCCGSSMRTPVLGDGSDAFDLVRCRQCGLVHALGHHRAAVLDAGYGARAQGSDAVDRARKRRFVALYDRLADGRISAHQDGARALDLGCNTGMLLDALAELGWIGEGVERSPGAAQIAGERHRIHDLDLEDPRADTGGRYGLVTITHVLEHMRQPVTVARFIARHLEPGGIAVIEVPNWDDIARGLWGRRYRPLELGDHISFFDRSSLRAVLELGGLHVDTVWSQPQGATLVMPSLLTAFDMVRSLLPRRGATSGAMSARTGEGARASGGLRAGVLGALDRLDPVLERLGDARWGANLVALCSLR